MKKIFLLLLAVFLTSGCSITKDDLDGAKIYTTVYPIEYLINTLYSDHSTIESIYPAGADVENYELKSKQIKKYANSDLFIYNGLSNEKTIAKNLINKNNKLLIIDVSSGLSYKYGIEELWMSPNNYLMLAKNIRDNLDEYLTSKYIIENVNKKYDEFAEVISLMDADLRSIGKDATEKGKNTLVVTNDVFKYLENYGFNVVSIDKETLTETTLANVRAAFKKKAYKSIIVSDGYISEDVKKIIDDYKPATINVSTMISKDTTGDTYIVLIQEFIDNIRNMTLN